MKKLMTKIKNMRNWLLTGFLVGLIFAMTFGAMTQSIDGNPKARWWHGGSGDEAWTWAKEVETIIEQWNLEDYSDVVFEGSTADAYETTITVTDPTADRTVTIPNRNGTVLYELYQVENVTADDTITTSEIGKVFVVENDTDGISLTLPAVGSDDDGMWFVVCDVNETAASDVTIEPGTGDSINGASANVGFSSDGADELPCNVILIYDHSNTNWIALPMQLTTAWDSDGS